MAKCTPKDTFYAEGGDKPFAIEQTKKPLFNQWFSISGKV